MHRVLAALVLIALASPTLADSKPKAEKTNKNPPGHAATHCPPGLAKKNPPCVPPGQEKEASYRVGDRIPDGWVLVPDPWRYGIRDPGTYWRVGDAIFRVNRETGEVLAILGALAAIDH